MNILLITPLYPCYANQPKSEITYAIHYFVKEWIKNGQNVKVVNARTSYPKIMNIIPKFRKLYNQNKKDNYFIDNVEVLKLPIIKYPKIKYSNKSIKKEVDNIILYLEKRNFEADIIVCHMINPALNIAEKIKKKLKIPIALTLHSGDIYVLNKFHFINEFNRLNKYVDGYGFRSNIIEKQYISKYGNNINEKSTCIIRSGVEKNNIIDEKDLKNKKKQENFKVITVSRLIKQKNIDAIIKSVADIYKTNNNVNLTIIGDGPEKNNIINLIRNMNAEKYINVLKEIPRNEVLQLMREHQIFVLVSSKETLGLVYVEAMAQGCIVVGSRNEGIDGIIKEKENGFLCEAGNNEELKNILMNIYDSSDAEKAKIINNAFNTISSLTQEKVSQDYLRFIDKIKAEK